MSDVEGTRPPEDDEELAERIVEDGARDEHDATTRREAAEQELAEEDLSEAAGEVGQQND